MMVLALLLAIAAIFNAVDAQMPSYGIPMYGVGGVGYPAGAGYPPVGYPAGTGYAPVGYPSMGYPIYSPPINPTMSMNTAENANANSNTNVNSNPGSGGGRWY